MADVINELRLEQNDEAGCVRILKTTLTFTDSLEGLGRLSTCLYSQLRFITRAHKDAQLDHRGKDTGRVWRNPCSDFLMLSHSQERKGIQKCGHVCDVFAQGSPSETQHPGFFLDADHVLKFQSLRRKAGVQHKPRCLYGLDTASHSYH